MYVSVGGKRSHGPSLKEPEICFVRHEEPSYNHEQHRSPHVQRADYLV